MILLNFVMRNVKLRKILLNSIYFENLDYYSKSFRKLTNETNLNKRHKKITKTKQVYFEAMLSQG